MKALAGFCVTKGTGITRYMTQKWTLLAYSRPAFVGEALTLLCIIMQRADSALAGQPSKSWGCVSSFGVLISFSQCEITSYLHQNHPILIKSQRNGVIHTSTFAGLGVETSFSSSRCVFVFPRLLTFQKTEEESLICISVWPRDWNGSGLGRQPR